MIFYGLNEELYQTQSDKQTSRGGEGDLYLSMDGSKMLKVYRNPCRKLENKCKVMLEQSKTWSQKFLNYTAAPIDLIYSDPERHKFAGFVMNKKQGKLKTLAEIYDFKHGKDISYQNKVIAAMNICTLTYLAHQNGVIIGDFNHKNIGVHVDESSDKYGFMELFDNDSFQVTQGGRTFKCCVGMPDEMAPEISDKLWREKADLETVQAVVYDKYTDYYTMALHVFHLLMNGAHPFNARIDGAILQGSKNVGYTDVLQNAKMSRFYYVNPVPGVKPLKTSYRFEFLSPKLRQLFIRAFVYGRDDPRERPTAKEFYAALGEYYNSLVPCSCGKKYHVRRNDYNGECEMCRISLTK